MSSWLPPLCSGCWTTPRALQPGYYSFGKYEAFCHWANIRFIGSVKSHNPKRYINAFKNILFGKSIADPYAF